MGLASLNPRGSRSHRSAGPQVEKLVREVYQTPPEIAAKAARVLNPK